MLNFIYPLDVTGSALSNRVRNEFHTLSSPTGSDNYHFILPKSGPYYRDSMKVFHVASNRLLVRGVDWEPGHYFHSASLETEHVRGGIYQSILFLDRNLTGQIRLDEYFTLGSEWVLDENTLLEILSNRAWDPRSVTYELVSGKPNVFPPRDHMHPVNDFVGMREMTEATYQVAAAIRERTENMPAAFDAKLLNYYSSADVDKLIQGLAEQLLSGIAGPEIENLLRNTVSSMIHDYYTKQEVDSFIWGLSTTVNSMYTNFQISDMLNDKVSHQQLAMLLEDKADVQQLYTALENIIGGTIYQDDLDEVSDRLDLKDSELEGRIDLLSDTLTDTNDRFQDYVKTDELQSLIPNMSGSEVGLPASIVRNDGGYSYHDLELEISNYVETSGLLSSIDLDIADGAVAHLVTGDDGVKEIPIPAMTKTIEIPEGYRGVSTAYLISLSYPNELEWTFRVIPILTDDYNDRLLMRGLVQISDESAYTSTPKELIIARVTPTDTGPEVVALVNQTGYSRVELSSVTLDHDEALDGGDVVVKFPGLVAHRSTAQVTMVVLSDTIGNRFPINSTRQIYKESMWNEVIVNIPSVDLSDLGVEARLIITVESITKTMR